MLRKKLQRMTEVDDVSRHPPLLAALTRECSNTIAVLDSAHTIRQYTCLMYVFDFAGKEEYAAIATRDGGKIFAASAFAHWLLDNGLLEEVPQADAQRGDIVLYFGADGRFKHAGLSTGSGRVISKWGIGHLYEHGLLEVPDSYGSQVRFFKALPYRVAFGYFRRFGEENGIRV
jgi:hypothetical protein